MALLRYADDAGHIHTRPLDAEHFVIGRAPTCQLCIEDDTLSREHARIDIETGGRYRIRDLGSRNKTFVNGEQITETFLVSGDIVRFGTRVVEFLEDSVKRDAIGLEFLTPDRTEPPHCEWIKVKAPISLTTSQIEQLAHLVMDPAMTARTEDLADIALGQILLDLQAERGYIAIKGEGKTDLRPVAHRSLKKSAAGSLMPVSQSFSLAPLLQQVAGRYPTTADKIDAKLGFASTAVVAPLMYRGEILGVVYVDRPASRKPFPSTATAYLVAAGSYLGAMLGEASRKLARAATREGAAWMTSLRRVQAQLTSALPAVDAFDVAMKCFPGRARCGDFADVIPLTEQRLAVIVVDGGGHGMTGLAQASAIRAGVRTALAVSDDTLLNPSDVLGSLNRMIASSKGRQVLPTVFVGIDLAVGRLVYVNAGCAPPLLMVAPGRLVTLDQPSLVLGVDADFIYEPTRVDLPESFRLICGTAGLTEAANAAGEPLGDQRLHEVLLEREAYTDAATIIAKITQAWTAHMGGAAPDDDAMVVVAGRG